MVTSWAAYPADVFWALAKAGHGVGGADLSFDSDVPTGAGLSSSAALPGRGGGALGLPYGGHADPVAFTAVPSPGARRLA